VAGAALGVAVSLLMTRATQEIFSSADVEMSFHVEPRSLLIAFALGLALTYLTIVASAWRISRLNITAAIRDADEPVRRVTGRASFVGGGTAVALGVATLIAALAWNEAAALGTGISLILIGGAFIARGSGVAERPTFTITSIGIIAIWVIVAGGELGWLGAELNLGTGTFFAGGLFLVAAATFLIIYNADILLNLVRTVGVLFARAVPAVRTAVAYPLAARGRTGMTIAMLSLVVFALVMISTLGLNFRNLFLNDEARGGWDIEVIALPTNSFRSNQENPHGPLGEALDRGFYDTRKVERIARVLLTNPQRTTTAQLRDDGRVSANEHAYQLYGADDVFLDETTIRLQARAEGYEDDRAVWEALRNDPSVAVIDGSAVPGINYANIREDRFTLSGYESGTKVFAPIELMLTDTATARQKPVKVIGIMERGPSESYRGVWLSDAGLTEAFEPYNETYYVRLRSGEQAQAEADDMEEVLAQYGVSASSIAAEIEEQQSLSNAFFLLIQGFLAIGLGIGLVALTVIAFRTVVERRQQIGLLRALGFTRASVAWSFVLESAFIAILGIINGIWPALLLANRLLASDQFSSAGFHSFAIPWLQIGIVAAGVFAAAVLTTIFPSRQAASIPPAEALRYE
jgi:putative ABC transport system permease protein